MRTPPLPHQAEPIRCQVRSLIEGQGHLRRTKPRKHLTSLSAISILISHKIAILGIEREGSGSSTLDVAVILSRWDPMVRFIPFPRRSTLMERRNGHASRPLPARLSSVTQSEPLTKSRAQQHSTHLKSPDLRRWKLFVVPPLLRFAAKGLRSTPLRWVTDDGRKC
jgi:hypothetical protein